MEELSAAYDTAGTLWAMPIGHSWQFAQLTWGTWINGLFGGEGDSITLITWAGGLFNFVSLIVWAVCSLNGGFGFTIDTASKGQWGGAKAENAWYGIRFIFSLLMIIPVFAGFNSLSQGGVIWLGGIGINLADIEGRKVAKVLTTREISLGDMGNSYKVISALTKQAFCIRAIDDGIEDFDGWHDRPFAYDAGGAVYSAVSNAGETLTYGISGTQTGKHVELSDPSLLDKKQINIGYLGKCGVISFPTSNDASQKQFAKPAKSLMLHYLARAYNEVAMPVQRNEYSFQDYQTALARNGSSGTSGQLKQDVLTASINFQKLMVDYKRDLNKLRDAIFENEKLNGGIEYIEEDGIKKIRLSEKAYNDKGWMYLGYWYTQMSKYSSSATNIVELSDDSIHFGFTIDEGCAITDSVGLFGSALNFITGSAPDIQDCIYYKTYKKQELVENLVLQNGNYNPDPYVTMNTACVSQENCRKSELESAATQAVLSPFMQLGANDDPLGNQFEGTLNSLGVASDGVTPLNPRTADGIDLGMLAYNDPIYTLSMLGRQITYATKPILVSIGIGYGIVDMTRGSVILGMISGPLGLFLGYMTGLTMILAGFAQTFAITIVMLPAMVWTLCLLSSWWLNWVQAYCSAPLAMVLFNVREGSGFAGYNIEKIRGMLASVVLTPVLLVTGLLVSMYYLKFSFVLFNIAFFMAAPALDSVMSYLLTTGLVVIYCSLSLIYVHTSFRIIGSFGHNVLEFWSGKMVNAGNEVDQISLKEVSDLSHSRKGGSGIDGGREVVGAIGNRMKSKKSDS